MLEITYPNIPGYITPSATCTGNDCLSIFIAYWFGFAIYIAGAVALISLAIASIQLIASAGNPSMQGDAKDRIKGAILGMVLLFSSFIIIRTINPVLIAPTLTPLPGVNGIFYTNLTERKPVPLSVSDASQRPTGFNYLVYDCQNGPPLLLWLFNNKNFDYVTGAAKVVRINCGSQPFDISAFGSFQMAYQDPGVYFCTSQCAGGDVVCNGYMSKVFTSNLNLVPEPFNYVSGNSPQNYSSAIKSVVIINNDQSHYATILHGTGDLKNGGECTLAVDNTCNNMNIPFSVNAADIFNMNNNPISSGRGVEFYEGPNGWDTGKQNGVFSATPDKIGQFFVKEAENMFFDYTNVDSLEADICMSDDPFYPPCSSEEAENYEQCCPCYSVKDCPGSINILGKYLVTLYSKIPLDNNPNSNNFKWYCRTFYNSVPKLDTEEFTAQGKELEVIGIIPIK